MRLTLQVKLLPTKEQAELFAATQRRYVQLCNYLSVLVYETRITNPHSMYYIFNRDLRFMFPDIPSAMHACARAKVAGAYRARISNLKRRNRKHLNQPCEFKASSSVDYNKLLYSSTLNRISDTSYETKSTQPNSSYSTVVLSIASIIGRIKVDALIPNTVLYKFGSWKQATLVYRKNTKEWYFLIATEVIEPPLKSYDKYLGVDMGITNIATTSDGTIYSGSTIDDKRIKHYAHVRSLQKCNTRSARRRLSKIRKRMSNFIRTTNHNISKLIVTAAQRSDACIVLEQLKYLHESLKARKPQRIRMFGWSYTQLRDFITYKAKLLGISVISVDPKYSSQTCRECGHTERANRHGEYFLCKVCGHSEHADINAAINLAMLGMVVDHCQEAGLSIPTYSK